MKIISELPKDRILVNLKKDELANILGIYSKFDIKSKDLQEAIGSETEIDISNIYRKHRTIQTIQNLAEYNKARRKLEEMLDALTPIESYIKNLNDNTPDDKVAV